MSAIEGCRTAALGGHVARCENDACGHTAIAYNSCRNRHCPKCQGSQAREWLEARKAELLEVPYFHVVFTLPPRIGAIAYQNKAVIYDLLFKASAETLLTIAADPKRLGVKIGFTSVLHTWGSAMTHHPHVHMIVPGGGISLDGSRWISSSRGLSAAGAGAVAAVPGQDAGDAEGGARRRPAAVLRPARRSRRQGCVQSLPRAALRHQLARLCQAAVRRTRAGAGLSRALHPPRRHLQQPADQSRRDRRHVQVTRTIGSKAPAATRP